MPIKILNQPLSDLQLLNINETVYFYFDNNGYAAGTAGSAFVGPLELYGTEQYEWSFDSGNINPDKPVQTTIGPDPVYREVSFQNPGARSIRLRIYDAGTSGGVLYEETLSFSVFKFPSQIVGPEFVQTNQIGSFQALEEPEADVTYKWYVNGVLEKSVDLSSDPEPHKHIITFNDITRASIRLIITHGNGEKILQFVCVVSRGNATFGKKYESDIAPKLLFFNKEGDCLNFNFNEYESGRNRWEGDMIFHVNGNDTFKTQALYVFENVPPVTIDQPSLKLEKFQLFNQYGVDFQPTKFTEDVIDNIEAVNNSSNYYTKLVYGKNFHLKYPVGSEVYFENVNFYNITGDVISTPLTGTTIPDFDSFPGSGIRTFTVLETKQDAILVLTTNNNNYFNTNYNTSSKFYTYSTNTRVYKTAQGAVVNIQPAKIIGVNIVKVFNTDLYLSSPTIDEELNPEWNENGFEYLLYDNKRITVVNSQKNDGVYTVAYKDNDLSNKLLSKYYKIESINLLDLMPHPKMGFKIDLTFKKNRILLSSEPVDFIPSSTTPFLLDKNLIIYEAIPTKDFTPGLLKAGVKFKFEDDGLGNPNFFGTYNCVKVDTVTNLLKANTSDILGWSIRMYNNDSYSSLRSLVRYSQFLDMQPTLFTAETRNRYNDLVTLTIVINNKSTYNINFKNIGFNFETGNADTLLVAIQNYINTNIKGIGSFIDTDHVRVFELPGYVISSFTMGWSFAFSIRTNAVHTSKLPEYGLVGNEIVSLNTSDYDGFMYRRTSSKTFHIFKWDATNSVATWYTMGEDKKVVWVETTASIVQEENVLGTAYLVDTKLSFEQTSNLNDITLARDIQAYKFISSYQKVFEDFGLELFIDGNDLCISRTHLLNSTATTEDYFQVDFYSLSQAYFTPIPEGEVTVPYPTGLTSGTAGMDTYTKIYSDVRFQNVEMFEVDTPVIAEKNHKVGIYSKPASISENWQRKIEIRDIDKKFGLNIRINGINYNVTYDDIFDNSLFGLDTIDSTRGDDLQSYLKNDIIDIQETLMDWGNQQFTLSQDITPDSNSEVGLKYYRQLESLGVIVYLERSSFFDPIFSSAGGAAYGERPYDTIVIESKYPNVPITFDVVGAIDYRIKNMEIEFLEIGQTLTVSINSVRYSIDRVSSTESISDILERWVDAYSIPLHEIGIVVDHYFLENFPYNRSNNLLFYTLDDNTRIRVQVWTGKNSIPGNETFIIHDYSPGNQGIIIAGNEIVTTDPNIDLQSAGLATAMIIAITGSKFPLNNQEYNIIHLDPDRVGLSYQGPFWPSTESIGTTLPQRVPGFDWEAVADPGDITIESTSDTSGNGFDEELVIRSREFLRYPREGFDGDKKRKIVARWLDEDDSSMFFYDFSGNQLNVKDQGVYSYTGPKPLFADGHNIFLNSNSNRDLEKLNDPRFQQTVFDDLTFDLELIDSETDITPEPEPLQIFIGYRGEDEGVNRRTLVIERIEDISVTINTEPQDKNQTFLPWVNVVDFDSETNELIISSNRGEIVDKINNSYRPYNFLKEGFIIGQRVRITGVDNTTSFNQKVFKNNGFEGEIEVVGVNKIQFKNVSTLQDETSYSMIKNPKPPFNKIPAGLSITISVVPQEIAKIDIAGQTEIEDERFPAMLNILGGKVLHRDVYIFKEYDIQEAGIDWIFLNEKRKEMLLVRPDIYNYISSYKAVINAINYFGYNDISFNEYYLNIDKTQTNYGKLHKIEIPDIFNNSVPGWNEKDFIKKTLPNSVYQKTNLFNLTYRITDEDGNNILSYSLDEVIIKLLGLKRWLQEQTIPPGKRIKDITGVGEDKQTTYIVHDVRKVMKVISHETLSPVIVSRVEVYQQPVINVGETYNVHLVFEVGDEEFKPDYYHLKITTFAAEPNIDDSDFKLIPVQVKNEYRTDLTPYNFAVDRYADPFILVEIFCDNGYGANYRFRKTYNIEPLAFVKSN